MIEPGKTIDFKRDHYEQIPRIRKKKHIAVTVTFNLPGNFKLRKGLEPLERLGKNFTISRIWELDQFRRPVEHLEVYVEGQQISDGEELGRQFLTLISYRYIPNRTVPSDILRDESQAIANFIFGRMKGDTHAAALLDSLNDAAGRMLADASDSLIKTKNKGKTKGSSHLLHNTAPRKLGFYTSSMTAPPLRKQRGQVTCYIILPHENSDFTLHQ